MDRRWMFPLTIILIFTTLASCSQPDNREPTASHTITITSTSTMPTSPTSFPTSPPQPTEVLMAPVVEPALTAEDCASAGLPAIACTGVTANDQWEPVIREFNGIPMVLIPAGCFLMGNDNSLPEERPVHGICFDRPFWIDRTEVTVSHFAAFLNA